MKLPTEKEKQRLKDAGILLDGQPPRFMMAPASETIAIPVAEYVYLHRVDALMDTLLHTDAYSLNHVVNSIKETVKNMRNPGEAGADQ